MAESQGDVAHDVERELLGHAAFTLHVVRDVLALDELEREEDPPVGLTEVVELDDVGVVQLGEGLRLALEALDVVRVLAQGRVDDLERDLAPELLLGRLVDDAHGAAAQLTPEAVARHELFGQGVEELLGLLLGDQAAIDHQGHGLGPALGVRSHDRLQDHLPLDLGDQTLADRLVDEVLVELTQSEGRVLEDRRLKA